MEENGKHQGEYHTFSPIDIPVVPPDLTLRQFTAEDAEEIFLLIQSNPTHLSQFGDTTYSKYPNTAVVMESILNPANPRRFRFAIRNNDRVLVGSINITPDEDNPQRGEIGYYLGEEFIGKGYITRAGKALIAYAFERMGYRTIYAIVDDQNHTSIKVLERLGFIRTAHQDGDFTYLLEE